jgi:phosphopantetheinyl transferase (holo-ACP synthase)
MNSLSKQLVGHDLVDLSANSTPITLRHIRKVLHLNEISFWESLNCSPLYYWHCWAIKEAIYKLNSKMNLLEPFIFPWFDTCSSLNFSASEVYEYQVSIKNIPIYLKIENQVDYVQAIASNYPISDNVDIVTKKSSDSENQSIIVRQIVRDFFPDDESIELDNLNHLDRIGPPVLLRQGNIDPNIDISLSHDGQYVSACIVHES